MFCKSKEMNGEYGEEKGSLISVKVFTKLKLLRIVIVLHESAPTVKRTDAHRF